MEPTSLTASELEELRDLLEAIDYRMLISDGIPLPTLDGKIAPQPLDLTKERQHVARIRHILGLPLKNRGDRSGFTGDRPSTDLLAPKQNLAGHG